MLPHKIALVAIFTFFSCLVALPIDDAEAARRGPRARKVNKALSRVCPRGVKSVPHGFLWKPASDVPGPRGGKPVVLLTGRNKTGTNSILIFSSKGKHLCSFNFKAGAPGVNNGAAHYYSGWGSGCGKTGSQLASAASRRSSSKAVYVGSRGGTCIGPINPRSRVGGI